MLPHLHGLGCHALACEVHVDALVFLDQLHAPCVVREKVAQVAVIKTGAHMSTRASHKAKGYRLQCIALSFVALKVRQQHSQLIRWRVVHVDTDIARHLYDISL